MPRRPLLLETFDDRILCSASVPVDPAAAPQKAAAAAAAPPVAVTSAVAAPTPAVPDPAQAAAMPAPTADGTAQLTDAQRAAIQSVVRDSTNQIWFEKNVGQYPDGVHYGFRTTFGAMLVYADHLRIISNQMDAATGAVGVQAVDISFTGSAANWDIVPGGQTAVTGGYQQADGSSLQPDIFNEVTLRNVYAGVDLRLYSAQNGVLEFDWIIGQAKDAGQIRIAVTGQDGLTFNADGSATINLRYQDLTLKIPESYQLINGQKQLVDAKMVAGDNAGEIRYELTGNIVADAPLVIDPNVAWSTYFDLNDASATGFDSYLFAINANANGVYAFGWVKEIITSATYGTTGSINNYMQVNAGFAGGTAAKQAYIYRFDTAGLNITAWTGTGITNADTGVTNQKLNGGGNDTPADLEFFPDGRVLAAFNGGLINIYSADLATRTFSGIPVTMDSLNSVAVVDNNVFYASGRVAAANAALIPAGSGLDDVYAGGPLGLEGIIIRYGSATTAPAATWATYVGGNSDEYFTAIALTPDKTKLVFATTTLVGANYPLLVNAIDSTLGAVGTTELLVGVLTEQAAKPAAFSVFSYLGGSGNEGTLATNTTAALVTATDTYFYVGGNTASVDLPGTAGGGQAANGGGLFDAFASRIPLNGSLGVGFQSTYLGGTTEDNIGGIAYDIRADRLLVFGTTNGAFPTKNTTPASNYFQGAAGGGLDIFVATFTGDLTNKDYATYIGGALNDYLGQTGDLIGQGHVVYNQATGLTYLATTVHSNLPVAIIGTPPGKDTVKSNPTTSSNDVHVIFAFNINIFDYGDAPVSYEGSPATPAEEAISSTIRIGATVDAEAVPQNGVGATGDDTLGPVNDEDGVGTLPVLNVGDATYSAVVSVFNNSGAALSLLGWIDFNLDGVFQASEMASVSVPTSAAQQNVTLTWAGLPALSTGQSYLRLRLSDTTPVDNAGTPTIDERSIGAGGMGEIEDHALSIVTSSLTGTVYSDLNNDGVQFGAGETGIAGATITVTGTNDLGVAVNVTTTTNASGVYTFANLRPSNAGGYIVTETQPAGFLDGKNTVGNVGGTTVNNPLSDVISSVVLAANTAATGYNFGELPPSTLSGTVYSDLNNDGIQFGAGETGISGVTVTVTGTDDLGNAVNTSALTNGTGGYSFGNLRPGTYTLTETQPAAFLDGKNTAGTSGGTTVNNPPSDVISAITLAANVAATGYNFGELSPTSLSGTVYNDLNNDGIQLGAGETRIIGVTVTLTGTDDLGVAVNTSTATNASGAYTFANMRPGTYTLTETQPAGLLDGRETAGAGVTTPGTVNNAAVSNTISNIVVASGQTGTANNFGELPPSSFAGTVFTDSNNDGVQLGGTETGISGATVTLTGTDDFGAAVTVSTTTNGSGAYAFGTLRPGTYVITETQPAGFLDGKNTAGTAGGTTVNNPPSDIVSAITLAANVAATGYNFGELQGATISGSVYLDANNDGIFQGGETAQSGVTVALTGTDDLGNAVSLSTTTNAGGAYAFAALRPGTYTLTETQPAGRLDGKETAGAGVTTPGAVNNAIDNNTIAGIVIASGQTGAANNFGELAPASLAATVYRDVNNDGVQLGAGETGISGATVTLTGTDDRGNAVSTALLTDASGNVSFANLRPGNYTITETQPGGFNDGLDSNGAPAGTLTNDQVSSIAVVSGTAGSGYKFGELPTTSISGTVYRDLDNDGLIAGAGETGIQGATVTLSGVNDLGNAVNFTTTTDVNGNYTFAGLRPSNASGYTITETQPAGFLDGKNTAGSAGGATVNNPASDVISSVVLASGTGATGYNFGELPPSTLSGAAYVDANNDGVFQGGETAQLGVTVTLTGTDDLGTAVNLTTTTGAGGAYTFGNLRPGTYTLTETQPAALLDGRETAGTQGSGTVDNTTNSNTISGITLAANVTGAANNFGDLRPAALAGAVFSDGNNDGLINGADAGIGGATVTLTGTDDRGNAVNVSTATSGAGAYAFGALRPGTYTLTQTQPAGFLDGKDIIGTPGGVAANDVFSGIALTEGTNGAANNFAELAPASLAGSVYIDANNDGVRQGGESGLAGVTVTLSGTDDLGNVVSATATTGVTGAYSFGNLRPSNATGYTITETQPGAYGDGTDAVGTQGGTAGNDVLSGIVLTAGVGGTGNIFGERIVADLSITKTDGSATYTAGTAISYSVVVSNTGPSFVTGATVADTIPANISGAAWTAVYAGAGSAGAVSGSGDINTAIDLASGGSATFTITGTVLATATGNLVNTATVAAPAGVTDPTPGNNSATDTDTPNPIADLAITKTDGVVSVVPGTANTYTIVVSNVGPSFVTGATVADTLPAALTGVNWTAAYAGAGSGGAAGGSGNISTVINLAVGGTATFTVTGTVTGTVVSTATGTLVNTATVTPPVGVTDPTPGNNTATDTDTLTPTADLSITKTDGSATYTAGTAISYSVVVNNSGPSFVSGAVVADTIPANIGGATWTAVYAGVGSTGAASGSGDINTAINLASGGSATFTITGTVLATATGNLVNTATVAAPAGVTDPTPGNNTATDTDTPDPVADLAITKTDGVGSVVPGTANTYTIVVSNVGPSFVTGATVADTLPAALTGVNWTAVYAGAGSSGAASGSGNISTVINLAVGGTATFSVTGTVAATATGTLVNTATVTPPVGVTDPTPGNNSATDMDTLTPTGDLSITKTDGSATYIPGTAISYTVVVNNTGPSFVSGAVIADTIPANIGGATWTAVYAGAGSGGAASGSGDINAAINLASGGSATFTITGTVLVTATGNLVNTATVAIPVGVTDPTPGNNSATDTDTRNTTSLAGFVFNDTNNDGIRQGSENGIGGATLTLTGTDDLGAAVNVTVATLADGSYSFVNLRPSNAAGYTITETQPAGFLDGADALGTPGGTAGNDVFSAIVLADGVSGAGNNFGELRPAMLSGTVFQDDSNDGTQQAGEPGVANVPVTLTGTDDRGNAVNATVNTLADGSYSFGNLRLGTYVITETQPAGLLDGKDALGTAGGTLANDQSNAITLAEGQTGGGYTFGELAASSFSGTVYSDLNNDGVQLGAGETGIGGAALTLTGTDDLGNAVSLSTVSAPDGSYTFGGLRPGSYVITETQPAGFLDGKNTAGTAGGTTVNNPPSDVISAITLTSNTGATGYLFGELTPASFSGTVFHDLNNDGVNDPTDLPIAGATVTLTGTDDLRNAVNTTATSAADGTYTFASLRPGTYTLTETQPAGYLDGIDTAGAAGGTPANDSFSALALVAGQTGGGYLFGELTPPDLVVTKTDGTATAKPGDLLTYTITVANASLQQADSVTVTDQFPSGLQFVSASNGGTLDPVTGVITWNVGAIAGANAQTVTLTVIARVPSIVPASLKAVTNTVTARDVSGVDGDPKNNTASDTDSIPASADLYVHKTDNLVTAKVGQQTTYTITGGNAGEQTAEGVVISDALPPGLRFVSASNGGHLAGGRIVWNLGDLAPGATFQLRVHVVVESAASGKNVLNTVTIADRFGSPEDLTPLDNSATDATRVEAAGFFAFDTFRNFANPGHRAGLLPLIGSIDVSREALLPLAPVYSGEADPGSALVVALFNAKGEQIGSQTVMVDSGGNWLTSFASSIMRDTPSSVRISLLPAPASYGDSFGHNLRAYFSPALNPGHFFETIRDLGFDRGSAPLLDGLGLENPLQLGSVKYGGELLSTQGTASGE